MKYLFQGREQKEKIEVLIEMTNIRSDELKECIISHLCNGEAEGLACLTSNVTQSNFNRGVATLNKMAEKVEQIKEIEGVRRIN